ncbi:MAG: heat-inducible transcriptional repressor HrcA [Acidimicrobiia bacterium]|nr:heat-inducible transcriptional repressor HrcA [Acidimicrobiia bacterium]
MDERKSEVLRVLVEEYISTGEPVSSRAILECSKLDVSPATIRNDLGALDRDGMSIQPHTSAGRVPTGRAYRYYVDHLTPRRLRAPTREKIRGFFSSVHQELGRLLKSTSELVADLSKYPAIVTGPGSTAGEHVHGINLVHLGGHAILLVLVSDAGSVRKEVLTLENPVEEPIVREAERILSGLLHDRLVGTIDNLREEIPSDLASPVREVVLAGLEAACASAEVKRDVYVGGTSQMAALWEDLSTVHRVLEMLERETLVMGIMASSPPGTVIQIGDELPMREDFDLAMISTPYEVGGVTAGRIGVLGPMRMDYSRTISIVEEVSDNLADNLGS